MEHELKTWPEPFEAIVSGRKRYEIRREDRSYETGDTLLLRQWSPDGEAYTGRQLRVRVTHMSHGGEWGLPPDLCVMSIKPVAEWP